MTTKTSDELIADAGAGDTAIIDIHPARSRYAGIRSSS
jgi:hypothetical protein